MVQDIADISDQGRKLNLTLPGILLKSGEEDPRTTS